MLTIYPAVFYKEKSGYSVIFPDLNYTATCGENLVNAMTMAIDCLAGLIYSAKQNDDKVPQPSNLSDINPKKVADYLGFEYIESFVNLVSVDVEEYAKKYFEKSVKKTLTIPAWLNDRAIEEGVNFSQVLKEALISRLSV